MVAGAEADPVVAVATQSDLVAVEAGDDVVATQLDCPAARRGDRLGAYLGEVVAFGIHLHVTVVAQDCVGAGFGSADIRGDGVAAHAAQDRVVAGANRDDVGTARGLQCVSRLEAQRLARPALTKRHEGHEAVVADDDVVA